MWRGCAISTASASLMTEGVKGRRVLARWKGLREQDLFEGRDLPATIDHREVLGEVLTQHMGVTDLGAVFPGFAARDPLGLL